MGIQIHELTALNRAPQTGDVLAVDTGTTTNKVDYSALRGAVLTDAVRTDDDQNLTDAQKAQAIENIGAATQADVTAIEDEIGNTTLPTTAQTITGAITEVANGAVRYDIAQSLTSSEQIRARNNIGAANGAEQMILVQNYGKCLRFTEQTLTESQKTQARTNIGAASEADTDALETLVGNTTLPTTAQTVTGAIAEHETDISNINSAIGTVPSGANLQGEVDDLKSAINKVKVVGELTQLVKNGNFEDSSYWDKNFATLSVVNNECTFTVSNATNSQFLQNNVPFEAGHIYILKFTARGSKAGAISFSGGNTIDYPFYFDLTTTNKTFSFMFPVFGTARTNLHFWIVRSGWSLTDFGVGDNIIFSNIMLFDLTAMYGKNDEPALGIFSSVYSNTYYDYNNPIGHPVRDFHNTSLEVVSKRFSGVNRFDKSSAIPHFYVDTTGTISKSADYSISQMIYIGDLEKFSYSYTFRLALYKEDFTVDSIPTTQNTVGTVATIDVPSTAKYALISYYTPNEDNVQAGDGVLVDSYAPFGTYTMPGLVIPSDENKPIVTVSKSNRGDYSSILEALTSTDSDVEVIDGSYDIVAEFKAKYGNTFFDDNVDRTGAGDFKYGLWISNRTLKFDANTSVSFDLSDNPASNDNGDDRRFSLFNLGVNAVLDGAIGTTSGNWYAIHDDGAGGDYSGNYHNIIKNCIIQSTNMVNTNSIGGGFGRYSETDIDNCYFDNGGATSDYVIRYHNTWNGQAQPVCHIKNTYCTGKIGFWKYGDSSKVGTCTVCNCSMIGTVDLNIIGNATDNLRVLQWANDNRS